MSEKVCCCNCEHIGYNPKVQYLHHGLTCAYNKLGHNMEYFIRNGFCYCSFYVASRFGSTAGIVHRILENEHRCGNNNRKSLRLKGGR